MTENENEYKVTFTIEEVAWDNTEEMREALEQLLGDKLMRLIKKNAEKGAGEVLYGRPGTELPPGFVHLRPEP